VRRIRACSCRLRDKSGLAVPPGATRHATPVIDPAEEGTRNASNRRFHRDRRELIAAIRGLLGPRSRTEPLADADRAAALAAEARASHREAEPSSWALVRHEWGLDEREGVVNLLHAFGELLGPRSVWLILPGREPQAVGLPIDAVLDNPLGFAALSDFEMVLLDQSVPAGLRLLRHSYPISPEWELEVWGEPWLSAATRAIREQRGRSGPAS